MARSPPSRRARWSKSPPCAPTSRPTAAARRSPSPTTGGRTRRAATSPSTRSTPTRYSGELFDYFGGLDDLKSRTVRFIGEPLQRIAEDHLRILRFFRFHARYGHGEPDAAALEACTARANDLMALSRERIADELLKLLACPIRRRPSRLMHERGMFEPVLPEIDSRPSIASPRWSPPSGAAIGPTRCAAWPRCCPADPRPLAEKIESARLKLQDPPRHRASLGDGRLFGRRRVRADRERGCRLELKRPDAHCLRFACPMLASVLPGL
jgi:hypothetical protein